MAKFTETVRTGLIVAMIAGLAACGESEKKAAPAAPPPVPLTVGGSITGLSAGGLVLQLNGADDLAVNAGSRFKFPKALSKGSAYAVTVKSSPSTPIKQTCTVSQGSGNITAAAINNIAITCNTNDYAVGGKVSGLSGKGLVLQLNETSDQTITKNGNFVFSGVRLPDGSDYNVAIKTAPAKQACKIEPINTAPDNDTINIVSVTCSKKGRGQ